MNREKKSYKNRIQRIQLIILAVLMLALMVTACGSREEGTKEKDDPREADSITTETVKKKVDSSVIKDDKQDNKTDSQGFTIYDDYVVTIDDLINVRTEPNTDSEVYMVLLKGVDLHRTGTKEGWTRVKVNGSSFYISSNLVKETNVKWATPMDADKISHIVFIDPAKQIKAMSEEEGNAPGSDKKKAKMAPANIGISTGNYEYELMLDISIRLKSELERRGYVVILSRDSSTVELSNRDRAVMAAGSDAEIFIRLQAGSASSDETFGAIGFINTKANVESEKIYDNSNRLCNLVLDHLADGTGCGNRGIAVTDGMTVLNYCNSIPAAVINVGFLSNEKDDKRLSDSDNREEMARYIADGIDEYFSYIDKN